MTKVKHSFEELSKLFGHQIRNQITAGTLSAAETTKTFLDEINLENPELNAFLFINKEAANREAGELDAMGSDKLKNKKLAGVPIVVPDLLKVKDTPTTYGSCLFKESISDEDQDEIGKLRKEGAIILGKTNLCEFGLSIATDNNLSKMCHNPLNLDYIPGGTAGGCAAAIAAKLAPIAIAPDWGGAVRLAASSCGLHGLLPTRALVPIIRKHLLLFSERMFNRIGILARDSHDIAMTLNILAQPDARDKRCAQRIPEDYEQAVKQEIGKLKIAWCPALEDLTVDPQIEQAARECALMLKDKGHQVDEIKPKINSDYLPHYSNIISADRYILVMRALQHSAKGADMLADSTKELIKHGDEVTGIQYSLALTYTEWLRERIEEMFETYDLILTPTMPSLPLKIEDISLATGFLYSEKVLRYLAHTCLFNMSGHPAINVPFGMSKDGLPFGMQLVGPYFSESTLLRAAKELSFIS